MGYIIYINANVSSDKASKDFIVNNMIVNLNVLSALIKGGVVHNENGSLTIIVHCHSFLYGKTKFMEYKGYA